MRISSFVKDRIAKSRFNLRNIPSNIAARNSSASSFRKAVIGFKVATSPIFWWCVGVGTALLIIISIIIQIAATASYASEKVKSLIPFAESEIASDLNEEEVEELLNYVAENRNEYADFDTQITSCIANSSGIGTIDPVITAAAQFIPPNTSEEVARGWLLYVASTPEPRAVMQKESELLLDIGERQYSEEELGALYESGQLHVYMFPEFEAEYVRLENSVERSVEPQEIVATLAPRSQPERFVNQVPVMIWSLASKGILEDSDSVLDEAVDEVMTVIDEC